MSEGSEPKNSMPEILENGLGSRSNNVHVARKSHSIKKTLVTSSPSLKCTDPNSICAGSIKDTSIVSYTLETQSSTHTPLLSSEAMQDNDNITDMEEDAHSELNNDAGGRIIENKSGNAITNSSAEGKCSNDFGTRNDDEKYENPTEEAESNDIIYSHYQQFEIIRSNFLSLAKEEAHEGAKYYYIDPSWLETFLECSFNPNQDILITMGHIKTVPLNSDFTTSSFISATEFSFLHDHFGLESNHAIIERELVYSASEGQYIIDLNPLFITPHVFCNSPSQINKYNNQMERRRELQVSQYRSVAYLFQCLVSYFELDNINPHNIRLWLLEFESANGPTVIIPTTLKCIKKKIVINNKKRNNHRTLKSKHIKSGHVMVEIKQHDGSFFMDISSHVLPGNGLVGLNNLGNTCYMNSALQCLLHIPELNSYFLYHFFEKELNKDNPLGYHGKVAMSFGSLVSCMFDNRHSGNQSSFPPREFKYTIGHFNSLFADYHQQDSQEFIAYLLDGLHEDLNRVLKKPYIEKPELEDGKENDEESIKALARKCWDAHKLRNNSVIVDLFVSLYKSTLSCPVCNNVSITFDPYNDLTLPLPIKAKWSHKIKILPEEGFPSILEIQLSKNALYGDLKQAVSNYTCIPVDELIGLEILKYNIYRNFEDSSSDSRYLPISELISSGDDIWFYQLKVREDDIIIPVFSTVTHDNKRSNFGLPFLISLSNEERKSYGVIKNKLFRKYSQLSTSNIFNKLQNNEFGKYSYSDFSDMDLIVKHSKSLCDAASVNEAEELEEQETSNNDEDSNSMISYASPDFSNESIFTTRVFDSSFDRSYYNRTYNFNSQSHVKRTGENTSFWSPANSNTIIRDDLPLLINGLPSKKQLYYLYSPQYSESVRKLMVEKSHNSNTEETGNDMSEDIDLMETDQSGMDLLIKTNDHTDEKESSNLTQKFDSLLKDQNIEEQSPDAEEYFTATEYTKDTDNSKKAKSTVLNFTDSPPLPSPLTKAECIPSSSSSSSLVESPTQSSSSSEASLQKGHSIKKAQEYLINPFFAIVNEFNEFSFDLCFLNTDDSEESGSNTWTSPNVLFNEDLENEKRLNAENAKKPVTVYDCLDLFSTPEVLSRDDLWYCPKCKEHRQATKKIELWSAPDILTIHLKRFESTRSFSDKIDIVVDFPIEGLDLTKYIADEDGEHIYDLFAVDNHYGGLGGGHYTAYVKNFTDNNWYYFDDSRVSPVLDPTDAVRGSAYLLFYRKRSQHPLGGEYFQNMKIEIDKKIHDLRRSMETTQKKSTANATLESDEDTSLMKSESEDDLGQTTKGDLSVEAVVGSVGDYKRRKLESGQSEPDVLVDMHDSSTIVDAEKPSQDAGLD